MLNPLSIYDLREQIRDTLSKEAAHTDWKQSFAEEGAAAVLFLLTADQDGKPALILTKRSELVPQPGDLCSPGGRISPWIDKPLSLFAPRTRTALGWAKLKLITTAALRESWEEIGLNPFRVELLGFLPVQELLLFSRRIYPVCAWTEARSFRPNREVEKILQIPLEELLDPFRYAAYDILKEGEKITRTLCFVHREGDKEEILWGAALKIVLRFLKIIFDFSPPEENDLPRMIKIIDATYYKSNRP